MRFVGLIAGAAVCWAGMPAFADSLSTRNRTTLFSSQLEVLDGRAATQYTNSIRLQPPTVEIPTATNTGPAYNGQYRGQYLDMAKEAARRNNVPQDLFLRLVQQESAFNPNAISSAGAIGLAQLMPGTARHDICA